MTAGEYLGVFVGRQQRNRFIERRGPNVIELSWNHDTSSRLIDFHTASGLSGMSICFTPKGDSASTTALTIAGVAPIVPASPTPFTPSGFTGEGVSVRSVSNHGSCEALGNA